MGLLKRGFNRLAGSWKVRVFLGLVSSVGLGWVALASLDWGQVRDTFKNFSILSAFFGLGLYFAHLLLRAYRWHVLFLKEKVSFWGLFLVQNTGIGINNLLPIRILSEPLQLAILIRMHRVSAPVALATLATEHFMDILATALLMGLGVLIYPELRGLSIQLVGALILAIVTMGVLVAMARGMKIIPVASRFPALERFVTAIKSLVKTRTRLLICFLMTVGQWVLLGASGWMLARGMGITGVDVGVMTVLFLAASFFTSAVPSAPGAVGTFEFAVILTLGFFAVDKAVAVPFALVMHVILYLPSTIIALVVLPRLGMRLFGRRGAVANAPAKPPVG